MGEPPNGPGQQDKVQPYRISRLLRIPPYMQDTKYGIQLPQKLKHDYDIYEVQTAALRM